MSAKCCEPNGLRGARPLRTPPPSPASSWCSNARAGTLPPAISLRLALPQPDFPAAERPLAVSLHPAKYSGILHHDLWQIPLLPAPPSFSSPPSCAEMNSSRHRIHTFKTQLWSKRRLLIKDTHGGSKQERMWGIGGGSGEGVEALERQDGINERLANLNGSQRIPAKGH